jgi:5-methylcytosine-specific restriction protein A
MAKWPYTSQRWQRLRKFKLQQNPLCELCLKQGRLEVATTVHHLVAVTAGGDAFPAIDKLESLCASCHNQITRCEQTGENYRIKGCDIRGYPLDPNHPWNQERKGKA